MSEELGAPPRRYFERYVAIGDSSTEGIEDPDGEGRYRGWANRLAETIARHQGGLLYANLAIRGRSTREIREEQLAPALAMQPDLVTFFSGTNDVISRHFDLAAVAADIEEVHRAVTTTGATLVTFTLPDLTPVMPAARWLAPRVAALSGAMRDISKRHGTILVDLAAYPVAVDPRLWSPDRLHANSEGHARIAAALAHALGLPDTDDTWTQELPPVLPRSFLGKVGAELVWMKDCLVPWIWRHAQGRSSGDGVEPKRPGLAPIG